MIYVGRIASMKSKETMQLSKKRKHFSPGIINRNLLESLTMKIKDRYAKSSSVCFEKYFFFMEEHLWSNYWIRIGLHL